MSISENEDSTRNCNLQKTRSNFNLITDHFQTKNVDSCVSVSPNSLNNPAPQNNFEGIEITEIINSELESPYLDTMETVFKKHIVNTTFDAINHQNEQDEKKENCTYLNNTENLNVTDYVNAILNSGNSGMFKYVL